MEKEEKTIGQTPPTSSTGGEDPKEPKVEKPKAPNVFSLKKDIDEFKEETKETNEKILGTLESILNKDEKPEPLSEVEPAKESEIAKLTEKQREIFEHYFDPADGFEAWYDINMNIFTINVPMKMSNTTPAYQDYYKQDLRSKKVDPNDILGSIKKWCELVAKNLKYERRIKLKQ